MAVLGPSRGVYLEGYGAVFTAEVNLVAGPPMTLFNVTVTKDYVARHKQIKIARIPDLKKNCRRRSSISPRPRRWPLFRLTNRSCWLRFFRTIPGRT